MNMNWWYRYQKIILIVLFVAFTCFFAWLLYMMFFSTPKPTLEPGQGDTPGTGPVGLPQAGEGDGQITPDTEPGSLADTQTLDPIEADEIARGSRTTATPLEEQPVLDATLSPNGSGARYYNQADNKFYQVDSSGNVRELSDKVFHDVQNITWAPSKEKAILEYPDGANIIYNFETAQQVTLPNHWKDFEFSPEGDEIVLKSMGLDPENRWLAISNADGSRIKAIEALGDKDSSVYPTWSANKQVVALHTKGVDFNRQEVFFIGQNRENFQSMIVEGRGFDPKWSPEGDKLLYSVYSTDTEMNPTLWISGAQGDQIGENRKKLSLQTWASKCTYKDNVNLLCAVPNNLDPGSGLFPELAETTQDELYQLNTITGLKRLVAVPEGAYNMSDLAVSENGFHLFFTDKTTDQLYKIRLK